VGTGVVVHRLGEAVVTFGGVSAAAVTVTATDCHVVVARDAFNIVLEQQRPDSVAFRAEAPEVAQAQQPITPQPSAGIQNGAQRVGFAYTPPKTPSRVI